MLKKIRPPLLLTLLILSIFSLTGMTFAPARTFLQASATPTPTVTPKKPKPRLTRTPTRTPPPANMITSTAGPEKPKPTPTLSLEDQAGNTNGVMLLGALIVGIIVIPIMLYSRRMRGKPG